MNLSKTDPERNGSSRIAARLVQALLRYYAELEADVVTPFLIGRRLLDLGAGEGFVARALRERTAAWICSVDVGPFRRAAGPYVTYDGARLPFPEGAFDTTLILLALHHCARPDTVLDEAVRVTRRRLIVMESTYRTRRERFWLNLLDERLNALRHDGTMSVPLAFQPPEGWQELFASRSLRALETRWLGPWWERLVHHPILYVLERTEDSGLRTESRPEPQSSYLSPQSSAGGVPWINTTYS